MTDRNWQPMLELLAAQHSPQQLALLLDLLLSHDEKQAIGSRLAVIRALLEGEMTQRQIASELQVSIATITRASNNLKTMNAEQKAAITTLITTDSAV